MKLDAKQRIALAVAAFVMKVLFPYEVAINKAWQEFQEAVEEATV